MFKISKKIAPKPIQNLFIENTNQYDLRNKNVWVTTNIRTVAFGRETLTYMGPKIWQLVPADIRNAGTLLEFKQKIKGWKPQACPCRLCKSFINDLGFI